MDQTTEAPDQCDDGWVDLACVDLNGYNEICIRELGGFYRLMVYDAGGAESLVISKELALMMVAEFSEN